MRCVTSQSYELLWLAWCEYSMSCAKAHRSDAMENV